MSVKNIFLSLTIGLATTLIVSTTAMAQSKILVVDSNRLMTESEVGKHIERQIQTIEQSMASELNTTASPYQATGESLKAELQNVKTQEELQQTVNSRPDLRKKLAEVQLGQQRVANELKRKQAEITVTERDARNQVAEKVKDIITRLAKERGADVVLEKSLVIYGDPVDVTDTVMTRLNAEFPRVTVVRKRMPVAPAQGAPAPVQ